jgi:GNAT superfamily N-acetyltransferase
MASAGGLGEEREADPLTLRRGVDEQAGDHDELVERKPGGVGRHVHHGWCAGLVEGDVPEDDAAPVLVHEGGQLVARGDEALGRRRPMGRVGARLADAVEHLGQRLEVARSPGTDRHGVIFAAYRRAMRVRVATPVDGDAVGGLLVRAYETAWGPDGWDGYRAELLDVAGRWAHCETLVAEEAEAGLLGCVALVLPGSVMRRIDDEAAIELRMLGVEPSAQRRGVATALLEAAADRARQLGLRRLVLHSDDDLAAAHALYGAHGFRRRPDLDVTVEGDYRALGYERAL